MPLRTPAALGYSMPAEWETHAATWLAWPHHPTDWPGKLGTIRWVYAEIIRKLAPGETVRLLVRSRAEAQSAARHIGKSAADPSAVDFIVYRTNRGWMRDSGPIFVRRQRDRKLETAIVHFHFNAWAKYRDWQQDRRVPEMAARRLEKPLFDAQAGGRPFVAEGGGLEVNGRGTLVTTEECYLDPVRQVRNPGMSRQEFEAVLREHLGVNNILWLAKGPTGDDTHGHIDDICRFVDARTLVLIREENSRDENYRPLSENWDRIGDLRLEDGSKPEIVPLPMPSPLYFAGYRLPTSYANFYISNAAVLVPTFNDPQDRQALGILSELFRDRPVVGIHAVDLILGFGSLHCLSQQQPAE